MIKAYPNHIVWLEAQLSDSSKEATDLVTLDSIKLSFNGDHIRDITGSRSADGWKATTVFSQGDEEGLYDITWTFKLNDTPITRVDQVALFKTAEIKTSGSLKKTEEVKMSSGELVPILPPTSFSPKFSKLYAAYTSDNDLQFRTCQNCMHYNKELTACQIVEGLILTTASCRFQRDIYELEGYIPLESNFSDATLPDDVKALVVSVPGEFADQDMIAKCLQKKKEMGVKIDDRAKAICINEAKKKSKNASIPSSKVAQPYVIHKHVIQNKTSYELGILADDEMVYFDLPIPEASMGPMLVDTPNVTRLFAQKSKPRPPSWLDFSGGLITGDESYELFDKGTVITGENNGLYTELFFSGNQLHGRWLLRNIPNVLDQSLFSEREIALFWKPPLQATEPGASYNSVECACPMKMAKSNNSQRSKRDVRSRFESPVVIDENNIVSGIAAAEGTWTDMFGNTYTYTSEFMDTLYTRLQEYLSVITTDKEHDNVDKGYINSVGMVQDPIKYITAKGNYNGNIDGVRGFSLEMTLRSFWNEELQSFIPFDAIPVRISLVGNPACKICWINQVN